jgi:hypothetical protein
MTRVAQSDFQSERQRLRALDEQRRSDFLVRSTLNEKEIRLNGWWRDRREKEVEAFQSRFDGFHPAQVDMLNLRTFLAETQAEASLWTLIKMVISSCC